MATIYQCMFAVVLLLLNAEVHSSSATFSEELLLAINSSKSVSENCLVDSGENFGECICKLAGHGKAVFHSKIKCPYGRALLDPLYCLTYDNITKDLVVGKCILTMRIRRLPIDNTNVTELIEHGSCKNRNGTLCGECNNNNSLAINSFTFECMSRSECRPINWLLYFVETLLPLTVFFCAILAFKIRLTTGHANTFLLFAQIVALPVNIVTIQRDWEVVLEHLYKTNNTNIPVSRVLSKAVQVLYGVWNLDILRGVFPNICTDHSIGVLEVFTLQYVTAAFPLVLIVIAYIMIQLHARNFRPVVIMWKPFNLCLAPCRRRLDSKTSVIDTFATFLLLSYTKFAHTSFVILSSTPLYNITGAVVGNVLLYDGSTRYFEFPHKYYAIAAVIILAVFVIPPPLLLFLYPMKWFQKLIDVCRLRSNLLTAFTDSYQGCYKDGLNGTKDCRFFAGIFFVVRFKVLLLYAFVTDYFLLYLLIHIILAIFLALIVIYQPYRVNFFNKQDVLLMTLYILITAVAIHSQLLIVFYRDKVLFQIFFYIMLMLPLLYVSCHVLVWFLTVMSRKYCKTRNRLIRYRSIRHVLSTTGLMSSPVHDDNATLPDRLLRPGDYT